LLLKRIQDSLLVRTVNSSDSNPSLQFSIAAGGIPRPSGFIDVRRSVLKRRAVGTRLLLLESTP